VGTIYDGVMVITFRDKAVLEIDYFGRHILGLCYLDYEIW